VLSNTSNRVNDVGVLETIATAHIYNVTVRRNRARGFLINNRRSFVEDCTFDQVSGPALLMDCEAYNWWYVPLMCYSNGRFDNNFNVLFLREGNCARNLLVRNNRFIDCNYGTGSREGVIVMSSASNSTTPQAAGVFQNITFTNNSFVGPVSRSFFLIGSASNVTIKNNVFENEQLIPIETVAVICSSSDVLLTCNSLTVELLANETMYPQGLRNKTGCIYPSWNINADEGFIGLCLPPVTEIEADTPLNSMPTFVSNASLAILSLASIIPIVIVQMV